MGQVQDVGHSRTQVQNKRLKIIVTIGNLKMG